MHIEKNTKNTCPFHSDLLHHAATFLRYIAEELPGLRHLAAIKALQSDVKGLSEESERLILENKRREAEREAEILVQIAGLLEGVTSSCDSLHYGVDPAGEKGSTEVIQRCINEYGRFVPSFGEYKISVPIEAENAPQQGAASVNCQRFERFNDIGYRFDENGYWFEENPLDCRRILEELRHSTAENIACASSEEDVSEDVDTELEDVCPQGHHKLDGDCDYLYCRCFCERCKEQCEKRGR